MIFSELIRQSCFDESWLNWWQILSSCFYIFSWLCFTRFVLKCDFFVMNSHLDFSFFLIYKYLLCSVHFFVIYALMNEFVCRFDIFLFESSIFFYFFFACLFDFFVQEIILSKIIFHDYMSLSQMKEFNWRTQTKKCKRSEHSRVSHIFDCERINHIYV